jgi:acyl dehydratase
VSGVERRELESAPSLLPAYAKVVARAFPLPLLGGSGQTLPERELVLPDVRVDRDHLAEYDRVCGFRLADELPITYPHVLAFPLAMSLMTDRSFPFALLGLVHVTNRIEQRRPLLASERPTLRVRAEDLRAHPRGRQFDVVTEAEVEGELVWSGRSTYLRRGGGSSTPASAVAAARAEAEPPRGSGSGWEVSGDVGRRYAAVSGDRNPIHLHGLPARALGMPGAVAHGMWTKARCVASLGGRLPGGCAVEVRFTAPLRIPAQVRLASRRSGEGWRFALWSGDEQRPHLTGSAAPLA